MTAALLSALALAATDSVNAESGSPDSRKTESISITPSRPFKMLDAPGFGHGFADVNGIRVHYVTAGKGEPLLLLHGWPFTWFTWAKVIPELAKRYTVIAPDLRGLGDSGRPKAGYDLHNKAEDAKALLNQLNFPHAQVVGHDLGASVAYMLARNYPETVRKLVVMEAVIGGLPGAEKFEANPPWWFAFHNVPGLAERVLSGHEAEYLDWFYVNSSYQKRGISIEARDEYLSAYSGSDRLRGGFEHYRAFAENTRQVSNSSKKLLMPTLALGGSIVGDLLFRQLKQNGADVTGRIIPECGHNIPDECPAALLQYLQDFLD